MVPVWRKGQERECHRSLCTHGRSSGQLLLSTQKQKFGPFQLSPQSNGPRKGFCHSGHLLGLTR